MEVLAKMVPFVRDKVESVCRCGKLAIQMKGENKELADLLYGMANTESTHLDNLYAWMAKCASQKKQGWTDPTPQSMFDIWDWEHKQLIDKIIESKLILQNYQRL